MKRAREEAVVLAAREILHEIVAPGEALHIVDPLAPDRAIGKAYIYPAETGWEVSGHYRRQGAERWSPFLMALDSGLELVSLQVRDNDQRMLARAAGDPRISVSRFSVSGEQQQDQPDH
ncbi:MAG: hypothetical protein R3192_04460 [Woeseiaceae bacterium]|nr:hypothetical protein [Woeseiaceae bacterium]